MNFSEELAKRSAYATEVVDRYIPKGCSYNMEIIEAMRYSLTNGGKRLRPVLIDSMYRLYNGIIGCDEAFMAAMEMLHTYSLIHDDLPALDNDEVRRGMPTCHIRYGEAVGILAGDGLLHLAYETAIRSFESDILKENALTALRIFGDKTGLNGMFGGQSTDVINTGKEISDELLAYIYDKKTGALIEGSMMIGAALAGADTEALEIIRRIGSLIGTAFQIRDDILDEYGDEEVFGKPIHSDDRNNKKTYLSIYGLEKAEQDIEAFTNEAVELLDTIGCNEDERAFLKKLFGYLTNRTI